MLNNKFKKILEMLNLDKPLIIFDLETTGRSISSDKIIQIAYIKILPNGRVIKENIFLNPEIPISLEAQAIHGINNEDVKGQPTFKSKSREIWEIFKNSYYSGFNIMSFDLPLLRREFLRAGLEFEYSEQEVIDSMLIFHYLEPRTLSIAYRYYCNKNHFSSHNALEDVEIAAEILQKQLQKYKETRDWNFLKQVNNFEKEEEVLEFNRKFYWKKGKAYFNFSKYRDQPLDEVAKKDPNFLRWLLQADFSEITKKIIQKALMVKSESCDQKKKKIWNKKAE